MTCHSTPGACVDILRAVGALACCLVGLVLPLQAQEPAAESSAIPAATSGAARGAPVVELSSARRARETTARATVRFEQGDYGAAVVGFQQAYELLAGDPRQAALLNNIAVCYERMFRYDLALKYYEQYLDEGAVDTADREEVQRVVEGLRGLLGRFQVTSNVPSEVWVDDSARGSTPLDLTLPVGDHSVEVRAVGHRSERFEVVIVPSGSESVDVELEPHEIYAGAPQAYFYGGVAVTAASLVAGVALGARALSLHRKKLGSETATVEDESKIHRLTVAADVCYGGAALFAVSTLVLGFLTDFGKDSRATSARPQPRLGLRPTARGRGALVLLGGPWR